MQQLSEQDIADLERNGLAAVSPQATEELGGWLLPFDDGVIVRARSAVPLSHRSAALQWLPQIAARYAARGFPAVFRTPDVPGFAPFNAELSRLGYVPWQAHLVQVTDVSRMREVCKGTPAATSPTPDAAWAAVYTTAGFDPLDGAGRVKILSRCRDAAYATVRDDTGQTIAAGVACFAFGWVSLQGMRTMVSKHGQGLAGRVLGGLADAAHARGLERVYLQVEEDNGPARALYRRAGFETAWRFQFWRPAAG